MLALRPAQVSIATFKLDNCETFIQIDGDDTIVAATVDHVTPEELGNVLLDRFQERFATGQYISQQPVRDVSNVSDVSDVLECETLAGGSIVAISSWCVVSFCRVCTA